MPHSHPVNQSLALVRVDGADIRKKIRKAYEKALRDLENSRRLLDRFHQTDQPQFTRWLNSNFGALLTELREMNQKLAASPPWPSPTTRFAARSTSVRQPRFATVTSPTCWEVCCTGPACWRPRPSHCASRLEKWQGRCSWRAPAWSRREPSPMGTTSGTRTSATRS